MLWEFTELSDKYKSGPKYFSDLGFTYSRPNVVRLSDGKWVALFGNGYDNTEADLRPSATGNAVLYVVDIATDEALVARYGTTIPVLAVASGDELGWPFNADDLLRLLA